MGKSQVILLKNHTTGKTETLELNPNTSLERPLSKVSDAKAANETLNSDVKAYRTYQAAKDAGEGYISLKEHRRRKARGKQRFEAWLPKDVHAAYKNHCQKLGISMTEDLTGYLMNKFNMKGKQ